MHLPLSDRWVSDPPGMTPGNYLIYALACGWVHELSYVAHVDRVDSIFHSRLTSFQKPLSSLEEEVIELQIVFKNKESLESITTPFRVMQIDSLQVSEAFDYVFVAKSPDYTPDTADHLLELIGRYLTCAVVTEIALS